MSKPSVAKLISETRIAPIAVSRDEGVSLQTVYRWIHVGIRGIRLESYLRGGRRFTTTEAVARFVEATSGMADDELAPAGARV